LEASPGKKFVGPHLIRKIPGMVACTSHSSSWERVKRSILIQDDPGLKGNPITKAKLAGGMAQVVEHLNLSLLPPKPKEVRKIAH
jgi:hypothetical protein